MPQPAAPTRRRIALVVDDEMVIANTLAIILTRAGFEAYALYSGQEVIDSLDRLQPDLLIIDVVMPEMTGIETAIVVRGKLPDCKILLFSGHATTSNLLERARAQGHDFEILNKPVHPTDLLAKLRD